MALDRKASYMRGAIVRGIRVLLAGVGLSLVVARPATAAGNPDFDAVTWTPLGCETPDLVSHTSPAAVDFAGNAAYPAAYFAHDASYLYFRYRTNGDPSMVHGFAQYSWTALM